MTRNSRILSISVLLITAMLLTACGSNTISSTATQMTESAVNTQVSTTPIPPDSQGNNNGIPPQGTPPGGMGQPPSGNPPSGGQSPQGNESSAITTVSASATIDGTTETQSGKTYTSADQDTSAIFITNKGILNLSNAVVKTTGNTSSTDNSSFYGLNAAILVNEGASLKMTGGSVTTSGTGANGVFSSGEGSSAVLQNLTITATGDGGHAVMATRGGSLTLTNVNMNTSGGSSSAIATDRGGGTITVTGGTVTTSGSNSAGIYSTGNITVNDTTFTSTGAEAAVIEGANSITMTNVQMSSTYDNKWGVMIYQSMSGDAEGAEGKFTMNGGSLSYSSLNGPLFYVTNSTGVIKLTGVALEAASGVLVKSAAGDWGNSGANGGTVQLTADDQNMEGNLIADQLSVLDINLQNGSTLKGAVNPDNDAKSAAITLDASSTWTVTANSYLTTISDASGLSGTTISNIIGNGHTVYYNASSNPSLGGKTYSLNGGGTLKPIS